MSDFPKVANLKVSDDIYDLHDNIGRTKLSLEKSKTESNDALLVRNKTILAEAITNRGVTTYPEDTLMTFAENISLLRAGDAPAVGAMSAITCQNSDADRGFRYNYPWVWHPRGAYYTVYSDGSGGYQYEGDNSELKDSIFVTRFKYSVTKYDVIPVIFCIGYFPVYITYRKSNGNIKLFIYVNGSEAGNYVFPTDDFLNSTDFYLKVENNKSGENIYICKVSVGGVDEDGNVTTYKLLHTSSVEISSPLTKINLSMLGVEIQYYVAGYTANINGYKGQLGSGPFEFGNYIKETCVVQPDDNGIYKVVLGASSVYPMP